MEDELCTLLDETRNDTLPSVWSADATPPCDFFSVVDDLIAETMTENAGRFPGNGGISPTNTMFEQERSSTPVKTSPTQATRTFCAKRRRSEPIKLADDSDHVNARRLSFIAQQPPSGRTARSLSSHRSLTGSVCSWTCADRSLMLKVASRRRSASRSEPVVRQP